MRRVSSRPVHACQAFIALAPSSGPPEEAADPRCRQPWQSCYLQGLQVDPCDAARPQRFTAYRVPRRLRKTLEMAAPGWRRRRTCLPVDQASRDIATGSGSAPYERASRIKPLSRKPRHSNQPRCAPFMGVGLPVNLLGDGRQCLSGCFVRIRPASSRHDRLHLSPASAGLFLARHPWLRSLSS